MTGTHLAWGELAQLGLVRLPHEFDPVRTPPSFPVNPSRSRVELRIPVSVLGGARCPPSNPSRLGGGAERHPLPDNPLGLRVGSGLQAGPNGAPATRGPGPRDFLPPQLPGYLPESLTQDIRTQLLGDLIPAGALSQESQDLHLLLGERSWVDLPLGRWGLLDLEARGPGELLLLNDLDTQFDALVADVDAWAGDQPADLVVALLAERALLEYPPGGLPHDILA
jgi:hypothetical protein